MAGTEKKRIIELTEASTVQSGDFIAVDSNARGTKKVSTDTLATSAALTAETNARAGADEQMSERMDGIEEQTALIQNPTKTISGALCSFTDGADMPMVACTAEIVPKQSGSGTPSPENVREISGWTEVETVVCGKNLLDPETIVEGKYYNVLLAEVTNADKAHSGIIPIKSNTSYCLNGFAGSGFYAMIVLDENKQPITWYGGASKTAPFVATTPSNARYVVLNFNIDQVDTIAFYESTTVDGYFPYTATTHTTSLGRTVYGGTLDVVSGVLTVDRAMVDLGTLNWTKSGTRFYKEFSASSPERPYAQPESFAYVTDALCSQYTATSRANIESVTSGFSIHASGGSTYVTVHDEQYDNVDAAAFKTAMSGVQLVYELATPTTYTLTGQEVSTLLGDNNVWADSGDVEITYRRDISIVINNLESALNG